MHAAKKLPGGAKFHNLGQLLNRMDAFQFALDTPCVARDVTCHSTDGWLAVRCCSTLPAFCRSAPSYTRSTHSSASASTCLVARASFIGASHRLSSQAAVVENPLFGSTMRFSGDDLIAGFSNPHFVFGASAC